MNVGEAVRLLRVYHDLKQNRFATLIDMSTSFVSEIENGRKIPSIDVIAKIAAAFDMQPSSLLYFAEFLSLPAGAPAPDFPGSKTLGLIEMSRLRIRQPV